MWYTHYAVLPIYPHVPCPYIPLSFTVYSPKPLHFAPVFCALAWTPVVCPYIRTMLFFSYMHTSLIQICLYRLLPHFAPAWAPIFCTDAGYSVKPLKHLTISRYFVEETCDVLPGIFLVITAEPRDRRRENATSLDVSDHSFQLQ